ncbi:hypothetical protein HZH66_000950 [Vespula vulgaris]|uniref:Uncharacterized protein n=1 Tax=Vespula vulgaris TaxID=7454 RepID=A0A834NL99_VESVU|nr:hypothetical protein HZH66_000950 [Vespula vulgaris]
MRRLGRCWDRLTNRNATLVDPGLKARPKTPPLCLFDSRVYLVAKAPRAPAGAVTLESSCVYDGLRGIPIQRSRDIRKQYPACTDLRTNVYFTRKPNAEPRLLQHRENASNVVTEERCSTFG